jgi:thiol:disulfide interchange protein DsbD
VQASSAGSKEDVALNTLKHASLLNMLVIFFGFGLLLSLTPCVLPMIPILSTIILGQQQQDKRHNFMLSLSYSLGMATVYTMLGVLAGLAGASMAAYLQQPWVLIYLHCF